MKRPEQRNMNAIGKRLRALREAKGYSQGDIKKRTGFLRCYVSRVECGHSLPEVTTLEKWAKALDLALYQLFFAGEGEPVAPWGAERGALPRREEKLLDLCRQMPEGDKQLFLALAREAVKQRWKHE